MKFLVASLLIGAMAATLPGVSQFLAKTAKAAVRPFEDQLYRLTMVVAGKFNVMIFAFPNVTDIVATTVESRSKKISDNVLNNNAGLAYIKANGNVKPVSGGSKIFEEISFAENANAGWYSGFDLLPVAAQDVLSAAEFGLKQAAVPIIISGLEQLMNGGREQMIDLMDSRMTVAESTMANLQSQGFYGDGTLAGGKAIVGLDAIVPVDAATTANRVDNGTYGNIDRATWAFWRPVYIKPGGALTSATIQTNMNSVWGLLVNGRERPDLIIADTTMWGLYIASLQSQQRFTDPAKANLGFPSIKFMDADVVLDGGLYYPSSSYGTGATSKTMYFLNTKHIKWRPHSARNMVPLNPNRRYAVNQDAEVVILAWAGAVTCDNQALQGRLESA